MHGRLVDLSIRSASRRERTRYDCAAAVIKGDELGHFEHGSTIVVFAPRGFALADGVGSGTRIRAGQALMRVPG